MKKIRFLSIQKLNWFWDIDASAFANAEASMKILLLAIVTCLSFFFCSNRSHEICFSTDSFQLSLNGKGEIHELVDSHSRINYLAKDTTAALMSVKFNNKIFFPQAAKFDSENHILRLIYENNIETEIKVESRINHLTFELISITSADKIELIVWGPFPTTIKKVIGETVGVVQGEQFAIGLQALNPKTLGGYPWKESDCMPQIDIFEQNDYSDLSQQGKRHVLYRVEAAKPADFGSTLQAYCRNRNEARIIENWVFKRFTALPFDDGGVVGSKIALFGCPVKDALATIGQIELAENLPHPMIDGEWGKIAPSASAAYLIMGFGEEDIDKSIEITKKAGLRYLYHPGPFENWGHFDLNEKQFPNGWEGLKNCVDRAKQHNIMVGVHTLSNFITTNDPYVTPVPDKRLAKTGISIITADIDERQTDIPIESPDFFNQYERNFLKAAVIGNELIRYNKVTEIAPWRLLDCQRGSFGTTASAHQKGDKIGKLADHAYKVFLGDASLSMEMANNIADLFNKTGLRQISFDGLEGNRSTGLGNYGEILFTKTWYENLNEEIQQHYIADASRSSHYFWHIYTRMNWGEPWYAGFRESQTEYRMKNQPYFDRNFMPNMLGWFKMTSETSIEDIEWMLARSAGFDAGYAFVTSYEAIEENGQSDMILQLLGDWEQARLSEAFGDQQKELMKDINNEFHLERIAENEWNLYRVYSYKFKHEKTVRQPGEPESAAFSFENPAENQPMNFILSAINGSVSDIKIEIDNYKAIRLPIVLKAGEKVKYTGGNEAIIYDKNWQQLDKISMVPSQWMVATGHHSINFDANFLEGEKPSVKLEFRLLGSAETVKIP